MYALVNWVVLSTAWQLHHSYPPTPRCPIVKGDIRDAETRAARMEREKEALQRSMGAEIEELQAALQVRASGGIGLCGDAAPGSRGLWHALHNPALQGQAPISISLVQAATAAKQTGEGSAAQLAADKAAADAAAQRNAGEVQRLRAELAHLQVGIAGLSQAGQCMQSDPGVGGCTADQARRKLRSASLPTSLQRMMTNDDGSASAVAGACRTSIADISDAQVGVGLVNSGLVDQCYGLCFWFTLCRHQHGRLLAPPPQHPAPLPTR